MKSKSTEILSFTLKIMTYSIIFGGVKLLKVDELIIALTALLHAISTSI